MSTIVRSFRSRLALRFGATVLLVSIVGSLLGFLALRGILRTQLDRSLLRLAEIEAAAAADFEDESVRFHEDLYASPAHAEASPIRYAEVWSRDGEPVIRTQNLEGGDLPVPAGVLERVAATGEPELFDFDWQGSSYRSLVYPLSRVGAQHLYHVLQVAAGRGQSQVVLHQFLIRLAILVLIGSLVAASLGWWLAGHAIRPVMQIIGQAESLDMRVPQHHIDATADTEEIQRLVAVLNSMLARIDQALADQRRFLADAGHEIKTPLTILRGDVEVTLRKARSPDEYESVLRQTLADLREVSALAEGLITLARSDTGALEPRAERVPAARLLRHVADRYTKRAQGAGFSVEVAAPPRLTLRGDATLLERALGNLVDNAIKYAGGGGRIQISAAAAHDARAILSVSNDGPGIPLDEQNRLFERFYRGASGRRSARGSGLGLAIVRAIVEAHGGEIELQSRPEAGTAVRMFLPVADAPHPAVGPGFLQPSHDPRETESTA